MKSKGNYPLKSKISARLESLKVKADSIVEKGVSHRILTHAPRCVF